MFSDKKLSLSSQFASISLRVYDFNQINIGETVHLEQQKSYNKSILKTSRKIDAFLHFWAILNSFENCLDNQIVWK